MRRREPLEPGDIVEVTVRDNKPWHDFPLGTLCYIIRRQPHYMGKPGKYYDLVQVEPGSAQQSLHYRQFKPIWTKAGGYEQT